MAPWDGAVSRASRGDCSSYQLHRSLLSGRPSPPRTQPFSGWGPGVGPASLWDLRPVLGHRGQARAGRPLPTTATSAAAPESPHSSRKCPGILVCRGLLEGAMPVLTRR